MTITLHRRAFLVPSLPALGILSTIEETMEITACYAMLDNITRKYDRFQTTLKVA